jgi:hypothetical protein
LLGLISASTFAISEHVAKLGARAGGDDSAAAQARGRRRALPD